MTTIPVEFWMLVIGALTVLFCLILFYVAMLVREATFTMSEVTKTIVDSRKLIQNTNAIVADVRETVDGLKGTISEVNDSIVGPIRGIGKIIGSILG